MVSLSGSNPMHKPAMDHIKNTGKSIHSVLYGKNLPFSSFVKTAMDHIKNTGKSNHRVLYGKNLPFSSFVKTPMDHIKNTGKSNHSVLYERKPSILIFRKNTYGSHQKYR